MKRSVPVLLSCALSFASFAAAAPAEPPMPAATIAYAAELAKSCVDFGGKPAKSPGFVRKADLTGDGKIDYLFDVAQFNCEGAASALANGQMGAQLVIYVTGANNTATEAFNDIAYGAVIESVQGKPVVYMQVAGVACGQKVGPNTAFADIQGCERPLLWKAATKKFAFAPLSMKRKLSG